MSNKNLFQSQKEKQANQEKIPVQKQSQQHKQTIEKNVSEKVPIENKSVDKKIEKKNKKDDDRNIGIKNYVEECKQNVQIPVSDDSIDYLESQMDQLNETTNLGEKVELHSKLMDYIKKLEKEVDSMIEMMDDIESDAVSDEIKKENIITDTTDVSDDIMNLDDLLGKFKKEDVMQMKMIYLKKLYEYTAKCREKCEQNHMTIKTCN